MPCARFSRPRQGSGLYQVFLGLGEKQLHNSLKVGNKIFSETGCILRPEKLGLLIQAQRCADKGDWHAIC